VRVPPVLHVVAASSVECLCDCCPTASDLPDLCSEQFIFRISPGRVFVLGAEVVLPPVAALTGRAARDSRRNVGRSSSNMTRHSSASSSVVKRRRCFASHAVEAIRICEPPSLTNATECLGGEGRKMDVAEEGN
jgi:hypothetical protein